MAARLGPMRSWIMALPLRSTQVSRDAMVMGPPKTRSSFTIIQKVDGERWSNRAKVSIGGFHAGIRGESNRLKVAGRRGAAKDGR